MLICGDFNITNSNNSVKFEKYIESCNIYEHINTPPYPYGHILDLILTPSGSSVVSNDGASDFISDDAMVLGPLDFIGPSVSRSSNGTFQNYPKIRMESLHCDLANYSFVGCPGDTTGALYKQYTSDLNN